MKTSAKLMRLALIFGVCLATFNVHAASSAPDATPVAKSTTALQSDQTIPDAAETETTIRELMELGQYKEVRYRDEHGAALTSNEFYKRVAAGQSFVTSRLHAAGSPSSALLSLLHQDVAPATQMASYKIKRGDKFPGFRLLQVDGHVFDSKKLSGHYTLVNFFFAQCGPCVSEVPDLNAYAAQRQGMNFVAITFDSTDDAKQFVADRNFEWKILPDAKKFIAQIGVHAYPTFALLDPHGVVLGITARSEMLASDNSLENWVTRMMAKTTTN